MSVSSGFRTFVIEQLERSLQDVRARSMFGGVGLYAGNLFFGLMDDDTVYFKVNDSNRRRFEERGMGPFRPYGEGGETMQYYEVPADVLEDAEQLAVWAETALTVARQARDGRTRPRR
jgi:DNA transformation protein and related proteins